MVLFLDDRGKHSLVLVTLLQTEGMTKAQLSLRVLAASKFYVWLWHNAFKEHLGYWHIMFHQSLLSRMTRKEKCHMLVLS